MGSWPHLNSVLTHTFPLLMQAQKHCPSRIASTHTATKIMRHGQDMSGPLSHCGTVEVGHFGDFEIMEVKQFQEEKYFGAQLRDAHLL